MKEFVLKHDRMPLLWFMDMYFLQAFQICV